MELNISINTQEKNTVEKDNVFIGDGVTFTGSMTVPNRAVIAGKFSGELEAREVVVDKTGNLTGKTTADDIDVKGELKESVTSRKVLSIRSSGKVSGKLDYSEVEIERGGEISGIMIQH